MFINHFMLYSTPNIMFINSFTLYFFYQIMFITSFMFMSSSPNNVNILHQAVFIIRVMLSYSPNNVYKPFCVVFFIMFKNSSILASSPNNVTNCFMPSSPPSTVHKQFMLSFSSNNIYKQFYVVFVTQKYQ